MRSSHLVDKTLALLLMPIVLVLLAILYAIVVPLQGRPFLFTSERMRGPGQAFRLLKIRTMHPPDSVGEQSVLGGDQAGRVTPIGRFLRKTRLDELPQIINVLRGDIRFIGPRPPLRRYVEQYPELYSRVLQTPPGITGLATVMLHAREERLLSRCNSPTETDLVYRTRCIPMKARLDLLYRDKQSLALDALILWRTFSRLFSRKPVENRQETADAPAPTPPQQADTAALSPQHLPAES